MSEPFDEYVARSYQQLVRSAYLLVGDLGHAEDLVQSALVRCLQHWDRIESADAYVRQTLVRLATRWRRRRWHGELPREQLPDSAGSGADLDVAVDVRSALAHLPWQQRAVLVLRYFDDRSEAETAQLLSCSIGTVKSRASRALTALRAAGLLGTGTQDTEVPDGRT